MRLSLYDYFERFYDTPPMPLITLHSRFTLSAIIII